MLGSQIAHEANGGGVWVNPGLISTDAATGLTDVILKVDHGQLQALDAAGAGDSLYRLERVRELFSIDLDDDATFFYLLISMKLLEMNRAADAAEE